MRTIDRLLIFVGSMFLLLKPFEGISQYVYLDANLQKQLDEARNDVYNEKFSDAVAKYALLLKDNDNKTVSVEYAYSLALTGCYDGAIMNLDKVFASEQVDKDVLFYTSQILKLMEYDSIAALFWTYYYEKNSFAPGWISGQYQVFSKKYRRPASINTDILGAALQRANKLANRKQYIQSMVLFLELMEVYPDQYLPCMGLSALLENLGFKNAAIKYLEIGINRMGTRENRYKIDPLGAYENHLKELKANSTNENLSIQDGEKTENAKSDTPRSFTHYGLTYVNKTWTINSKYGVYWRNNSYISLGIGYYYYENNTTYMADVALCYSNIIVLGIDVSVKRLKNQFSFGVGPCAGLSIPIGRTSIDFLSVLNLAWQDNLNATLNTSAGITLYF